MAGGTDTTTTGGAAPSGGKPTVDALVRRRARARRRRGVDVWRWLDDHTDLANMRPTLAPDVEIKEFPLYDGTTYALFANHRDEMYLRMNGYEAALARRMDGTRTVRELAVEQLEDSDGFDLDAIIELVVDLRRHGLLLERTIDVPAVVQRRVRGITPRREKWQRFLRTQTVEWKGAHRFVAALYRTIARHLYRPLSVAIMAAIGIAGAVCFFRVVSSGRFSLAQHALAQEGLILIGMNLVLVTLHELGHALTIFHFGRRVNGAGAQIYFGSLVFFIDSTDGLMLGRRHRITQAAAGAFVELTVAGLASIVMFLQPEWAFSTVLYKFAVLNYFVIFLNLVPLLELDGYWILSDVLRIPDLRARSLAFMRHGLFAKLVERERFNRQEIGLAVYGIVGVAFTIFAFAWSFRFWHSVFGPPIARMWQAGIPTRILVLVLAAVVLAPVIRGGVKLVRVVGRHVVAVVESIAFRLQRGWRVEAAELVDRLPLFADLDEDVLSDLAGRIRRRAVPERATVVARGERGLTFYVVRSGALEAVDIDPRTGGERVVRTYQRGDGFGELAVLTGTPRRVTVRAVTRAELFEIDKGTFDRLLAPAIVGLDAGTTMQDVVEVRELPPFRHLEATALLELMRHGRWVHAVPGETVIRAGEKGDAFYVIRSGKALVVRSKRHVGELGPGDHFGELALLTRAPRAATVRALTPLIAYRVERQGFDRLMRSAFRRGMLHPTVVRRVRNEEPR